MVKETNIQNKIRNEVSNGDVRVFRNNVGQAWSGKAEHVKYPRKEFVNAGDVILRNARPVKYGLLNGSSDLIGFKKTLITDDMVGKEIAVFVSIEVKTPSGKVSEDQKDWLEFIEYFGGIAGVATNTEEALEVLSNG